MTCLNLRMVDRLSRSQLGGRVCFPEPFSWASASQRLHGAGPAPPCFATSRYLFGTPRQFEWLWVSYQL